MGGAPRYGPVKRLGFRGQHRRQPVARIRTETPADMAWSPKGPDLLPGPDGLEGEWALDEMADPPTVDRVRSGSQCERADLDDVVFRPSRRKSCRPEERSHIARGPAHRRERARLMRRSSRGTQGIPDAGRELRGGGDPYLTRRGRGANSTKADHLLVDGGDIVLRSLLDFSRQANDLLEATRVVSERGPTGSRARVVEDVSFLVRDGPFPREFGEGSTKDAP